MVTRYNPNGFTTNCGFCAIAHGLFVQQGIVVNADELYLRTLKELGIAHDGKRDPIPRQLIFPEALLDQIRASTTYSALSGGAHGLSSYTITAVATANGLRFTAHIKNLDLIRQFVSCYADATSGAWNIEKFEQVRMEFLEAHGRNPSPVGVRRQIMSELGGHSIMGSKTSNHLINVHVDPSGHITAFDAQDGINYDGKGLHHRLRTVDLFMRLE